MDISDKYIRTHWFCSHAVWISHGGPSCSWTFEHGYQWFWCKETFSLQPNDDCNRIRCRWLPVYATWSAALHRINSGFLCSGILGSHTLTALLPWLCNVLMYDENDLGVRCNGITFTHQIITHLITLRGILGYIAQSVCEITEWLSW